MIASILGRFMVKTGRMTKQQLDTVFSRQDSVRVKMGLMAVSEGLMSVEQADEINRLQSTMDKRFGDIAITKGYLTDAQVGNLLKLQGNEYLSFVQTLVDLGITTMQFMEAVVKEFQTANGFTNTEIEAMKSGDVDAIIRAYLPHEAVKYQEIAGVAVRTILRAADRHVFVDNAELVTSVEVNGLVGQTLAGAPGIRTAFAEAEGGLTALASLYAKEEMTQVDEDSLDAAGELLNCINGLYASAKSRKDIELELEPPVYGKDVKVVTADEICKISVYVNRQKMYFLVSDQTAFS